MSDEMDIAIKCTKIAEKMADIFQDDVKKFSIQEFDDNAIEILLTTLGALQTALFEGFARMLPKDRQMDFCSEMINKLAEASTTALTKFYKNKELN